jgi:26S proteasome regulatory subunit N5
LPEATALSQTSLEDAIALLLPLEKKCRVNNDHNNLKEVSLHLVRLCRNVNNWDKLNAMLSLINKRSSQYKSTLTAVVAESMGYLDNVPSTDVKVNLLKALKEVTDGKIYLEGESAKIHFSLAKIFEDRGDLTDACNTIQDVHVETYGSLSRQQKAEYILEQIRLNLAKKDYIRVAIHSRKMNQKTIEEAGFEDIKIRFYKLQIEYYTHERNCWEIAQAYFKISNTATSDAFTSENVKAALEASIIYLLASKRNNHQYDMLHRIKTALTSTFKEVNINSTVAQVLNLFAKDEIIVSPFAGQEELLSHSSWRTFATSEELAFFLEEFGIRVIEHNLRVVAKYYERISLARLGALIKLNRSDLEHHLSNMSYTGALSLKIDQPAGIVTFAPKRTSEEVLSEWSGDITKMLQLMEATCHLINRETMVHKV